jgi:chemotaxis protein CheC
MKPQEADPRQLDAIREIVNIGAGHAATNLSALTGKRVMISIPRLRWGDGSVALEPIAPVSDSAPVVMIRVPIGSDRGSRERALLILSRTTAIEVAALMLRRDATTITEFGVLERSTLNELANIVCAAYAGVLGSFLGAGMMIGTPEFAESVSGAVKHDVGTGLVIETDFSFPDSTFEAVFVLSHADVSMESLLQALGLGSP